MRSLGIDSGSRDAVELSHSRSAHERPHSTAQFDLWQQEDRRRHAKSRRCPEVRRSDTVHVGRYRGQGIGGGGGVRLSLAVLPIQLEMFL